MSRPPASARRRTRAPRGDDGQAAVELVALLPLLALLTLAGWQAVLAGQAAWLAAGAARASARAAAVGDDPTAAARRTLPPALERGLRVTATSGAAVTVRIEIPALVLGGRLATIRSSAGFPEQRS
jgi:Flp pilus assembly protein TadG